jgi:hypothetical protein
MFTTALLVRRCWWRPPTTERLATRRTPTALLTPDGRQVLLSSHASNLVAGDTNALSDVFAKTLPPDVPAGTSVRADPFDPLVGQNPVTLVFDNVTNAGNVSIAVGAAGPPLPPGFVQASAYVDVSKDATTTGGVQVCASYLGQTISSEGTLRLMHWGGAEWTDITSLADALADNVCGPATTLGLFSLATPPPGYLGSPPAIATVTPNTAHVSKNGGAVHASTALSTPRAATDPVRRQSGQRAHVVTFPLTPKPLRRDLIADAAPHAPAVLVRELEMDPLQDA